MDQSNQTKKNVKRILSSKVFLFLAVLALIALAVNLGRESYRKYQLGKEIQALKTEMERLEGRNSQLAEMIEYFKDESYLEKEARLKLNLKKPGEKVVIYSTRADDSIAGQAAALAAPEVGSAGKTDNYWLWWEYFFDRH